MSAPKPAVLMDRDGTHILTLLSSTVDVPRLLGRAGDRPTDVELADPGLTGGTVVRPGDGRNAETRPAAGWILRQGR